MIKAIRWENIYNAINAITAITSLATVFSMKPDENSTPIGTYVYMTITSNNTTTKTQIWYIMKTARVSFHVVCKESLWATDTPERVLGEAIDTITNNIVYQWCWNKIDIIDWFYIQSILEDTVSPIFFADNRHYIIKDYLFNYISVT